MTTAGHQGRAWRIRNLVAVSGVLGVAALVAFYALALPLPVIGLVRRWQV